MELIIGGAYQGKRAYAEALYREMQWIDGSSCSLEDALCAKGMDHFELFIKRILKEEGSGVQSPDSFLSAHPQYVPHCLLLLIFSL